MSGDEPRYSYSTARLPRGLSHLVKRSDVDALLAGRRNPLSYVSRHQWVSGYGDPLALKHWTAGAGGGPATVDEDDVLPLAAVSWWPHSMPEVGHEPGVRLTLYAVPSQQRAELRALAVETILPDAIAWADALLAGPETRLDMRPEVRWVFSRCELLRGER